MSTRGNRDFRPVFHYTPPTGWINDPNGLLYENGTWHLFAQHNPAEPIWGPMHWRHAVSTDLLHWKDLGIAMAPDDLGMIFSGSAVIDHGNTSGLGKDGIDPMILIYTSHGETEQQSIAWSLDRVHFTPYEGNPVIPNKDKKNFRDTKVFRNEILNCWSMILAAGDVNEFYASDDLIHWRKTGEFGKKENTFGGIAECPDLFPLQAPDGSTVWVLTSCLAMHPNFGSGRMVYYLGEFDGYTFRETMPRFRPRMLDNGYDNYAAVTFANTDRRLMVGWGQSPAYAGYEPTGEYCCNMTYVRELSLVETDEGLALAQKPITPAFVLEKAKVLPALPPKPHMMYTLPTSEGELPGELFQIHLEAKGHFSLTLSNEDGEALRITLDSEQRLVLDRTYAGQKDFCPQFASGLMSVPSAPRKKIGPFSMDLYFDRMFAEIFADEGTLALTAAVFPKKPYTKVTFNGDGPLWIGKPV
jgi:fructan beta-fructosidase